MSDSNNPVPAGAPSVSSHDSDHINLRVTYLHAGNPRPPHSLGAVPSTTTIAELKNRLQADLLEHPRPEEQRLIFQGRPLMQNDATLRQALRLEGPIGPLPYTIHIIFQPRRASAHFRPDQASQMPQPQPTTGMPAGIQPGPPQQPIDPQAAMQQAQRVQAMAQAQLQMLQQQMAALNPAFAQNMGQMPQNFSATFQIHGQPIPMPQNVAPNMRPAPSVPNLGALRVGQPVPTTQTPLAPSMHNHAAGPHVHQHATPHAATHLTPNMPSSISPFARPSSAPGHPPHRRSASGAAPGNQALPTVPRSIPIGLPPAPMFNHLPHPFSHTHTVPRNAGQPTVWLASSSNGPQALLFAPGHGYFTSQGSQPESLPAPTPTTQPSASPAQGQAQAQAPAPPPPAANAGHGQVAIRQADLPVLPAQPRPQNQAQDDNEFWALVIQRGWLFLRLYMFMFVLSEPGTWRRYTLLVAAVIVCLLPRENPLNNAFAAARRHVDRLIGPHNHELRDRDRGRREQRGPRGVGQAVARAVQGNHAQQNQAAPANTQMQPAGPSNAPPSGARGAVNITPEQNARRLIREHEQHNPNILRDMFYWVEQAVALFLASLVPGVGERHVAAREEARREEERERIEAQRVREEEEKKRKEAMEEVEKQVADSNKELEAEGSGKVDAAAKHTTNSNAETGTGMDVDVGSSSGVEATNEGQDDTVRARFT